MCLVLDRFVVSGSAETWSALPRDAKDALWSNVRSRYTPKQRSYLKAGEEVYQQVSHRGRCPTSKRAVFEEIIRKLPYDIRYRQRRNGDGRGRGDTEISHDAAARMFERPPLALWSAEGAGRVVSEDDIRAFLERVHDCYERDRAQGHEG